MRIMVGLLVLFALPGISGAGGNRDADREVYGSGGPMISGPFEFGLDSDTIDRIRRMVPRWAEGMKKVFVDGMDSLWPAADTSGSQIMIVSSANDIAILINSQNPDVALPEELVEYSARSLEDSSLEMLTNPFNLTEFNGHQTYVFNADLWAGMGRESEDAFFDNIFRSIIHEGVHLLLQEGLETAEQVMGFGESAEETGNLRYYRNEVYSYLKDAAKSGAERDTLIKKAMFYHRMYLEESGGGGDTSSYDYVEGLATYLSEKALVMLEDDAPTGAQLKQATMTALLENFSLYDGAMGSDSVLPKFQEPYQIGAIAIALLELGGRGADYENRLPLDQLLALYGYGAAEGHPGLDDAVREHYEAAGNRTGRSIGSFLAGAEDPNYAGVLIPRSGMNESAVYDGSFINYRHNGIDGMIVKISTEIRHPNGNRMLLDGAEAFEYFNEDISNGNMLILDGDEDDLLGVPFIYVLVYVPIDDLELRDNKLLTIQRDDIVIFDAQYRIADGIYEIVMDPGASR